ncbi:hypothetical protein ASPCAL09319 [Aspergillus calidoustus]|uniref:Uncharacterized protein n=1 Tax=Aspergillus calidoustus TaxID=454130 RepID=A0A0U5GU20_ASPCI|nr:hypothetical protein ASPCAL09319 [Aspergillus calidoustus]
MPSPTENPTEYDRVSDRDSDRDSDHDSDQDIESPPHAPKVEAAPPQWGIGWQCPTMMIGFAVCGALLALGHHLYYDSLDNTLVTSTNQQTWAIRIGTGFAFLVKASLVSAVGVAAVQEIWAVLRRKYMTLRGIDGMFAVLTSPLAFLVPDLWMYAKILTMMAIVSWVIPLTAVITPATLSVRLLQTSNITATHVPTLKFSDNSFWRPWVTDGPRGEIITPAPAIMRQLTTTASSMQVPPFTPPSPNSSYTLEFWGPSYDCRGLSEVGAARVTNSTGDDVGSVKELWEKQIGNEEYWWYKGVWYNRNMIFVYAKGHNPLWDHQDSDGMTRLVCQLWNTSYVAHLNYTNSVRTLTPLSTELIAPSNFSGGEGANATIMDQGPEVNGGFYLTHLLFGGLLSYEIWSTQSNTLLSNAAANAVYKSISPMETALFGCAEFWNTSDYEKILGAGGAETTVNCRNGTLAAAIADLSRNFTYSLLSLNAANTLLPVTVSSGQNFYSYNVGNLLAAYMSALGATVACVIIGLVALYKNGVPQSTSFSSVLMTTRNPELDRLAVGHCLGSEDSWSHDAGKVQLRFGELDDGGRDYRHAAFGTKGSVTALSKGAECY